MKNSTLLNLLMTGLVLSVVGAGCKKNMDRTQVIPYQAANTQIKDPNPNKIPYVRPPIEDGGRNPAQPPIDNTGVIKLNPKHSIEGRDQDRTLWADKTIRFAYDSSVVKAGEGSKVEAVATAFKAMDAAKDLLVEGHCDERGTEEYNRALGERRALAMREYLIRLGVPSDRIHTKTLGKDQPVEFGHNEAAWSKNRRGEFILVK